MWCNFLQITSEIPKLWVPINFYGLLDRLYIVISIVMYLNRLYVEDLKNPCPIQSSVKLSFTCPFLTCPKMPWTGHLILDKDRTEDRTENRTSVLVQDNCACPGQVII